MSNKIDITLVSQLKRETNLTISECKQLLEENNWDYDVALHKSVDVLKEKAKLYENRETDEGIIAYQVIDNTLYYIKYLFQTDVIYKSELFSHTVNKLFDKLIEKKNINDSEVLDICAYLTGTAQEKCKLSDWGTFTANKHLIYYMHNTKATNIGKTLVALDVEFSDNINEAQKNIISRIPHHFAAFGYNLTEAPSTAWLYDPTKKLSDILDENNIKIHNLLYLSI